MKFKNIIYVLIALAFAGAIVYKAVWSKPAVAGTGSGLVRTALPVNMLVVGPQEFTETLSVIGTVEANEEVLLKSEVSGKITGISFDEGTRVEQGALLIKVYDDDLQAQLTKAKANLKLMEDMEARQRQLLEREAISREDYDVAYANLQSAQADVALYESQISKTEIRAPFDGTIGFRKVSPGEYITPGTEIATLVNDDPAKIQFAVPEKYSRVIGKNSVINYKLEGMINERRASVYAVDPAIDAATRTLRLKALSPNPRGELIPGAFVRIDVLMGHDKNVILIPAQAVISETDGQKVYLYRGGKAEKVTVQTDTRTNNMVEIVRGINPGDTLITTGMMQITAQTRVTPAKIDE
jgi:membrane fusion protein (multidrug efflux system)